MSGLLDCGSQCLVCSVPVRFDTYKGCSHGCSYCFVKRKTDINETTAKNALKSLEDFIQGKRNIVTGWADWNIPLHFGGMSDPFQPLEQKHKLTLKALEIFAKYNYPFIISTKNPVLAAQKDYFDVLKQCNVVFQISMLSPKYDELEKGAPTFNERLDAINTLKKCTKRIIIRAQPYTPNVKLDILTNIKNFKDAGAYGITIEALKFNKTAPNLVKVGADYCFKTELLKKDYLDIKAECKKREFAFFCAENRLRHLGDGLDCCGFGGVEGFKGNDYNVIHLKASPHAIAPTTGQLQRGKAFCFKSLAQTTLANEVIRNKSFKELIDFFAGKTNG